jgi:hypothetical protein
VAYVLYQHQPHTHIDRESLYRVAVVDHIHRPYSIFVVERGKKGEIVQGKRVSFFSCSFLSGERKRKRERR